jgi:hypothetical protein
MDKQDDENQDDKNQEEEDLPRLVSLVRRLFNGGGNVFESTAGSGVDRDSVSEALEQHIKERIPDDQKASIMAKTVAAQSLAHAESALNKTAGGASPATLTDLEVASLEAIIEVTGRPAIRYSNGQIQNPNNLGENERWKVLVVTARHKINDASAAVGRIMITGAAGLAENIGTGWRIGNDLVVTNRHVAQLLAVDPNAPIRDLTLDTAKGPLIDFSATDDSDESKNFGLAAITYCAEEPFVDVAILRTSGVTGLPDSLELDWNAQSVGRDIPGPNGVGPTFKGKEVYVVGHPFRQRRSQAVATVFGTADGLKRWSPGLVLRVPADQPTLQHDCSTLGGNSGSCVFSAGVHKVVGIHMGGVEVDEVTDRGLANVAIALSRLGSHPVVQILKDATV